MAKFVEIVPVYPHKYPLRYKEDYFYWPARLMQKKGFDVEFLTTQEGKDGRQGEVMVKRLSSWRDVLSRINKDKEIKLVHSHLRPYPPSFFSAFSNKPKILSPHTYILGSNPVIAFFSARIMNKFDKIITFTPYESELYRNAGLRKEIIAQIAHPIDHEFYSQTVKNKESIKLKYGVTDEFVICYVANIRKFKRIGTLLKAFKLVNEKIRAKLIIAGADLLNHENEMSVKSMIATLGVDNVITTGLLPPEQVRELFSISDVFVNTSDNEAQGLSIYEAAAAGLPLCLSSVGSLTTVFGDLALYHQYEDHRQLASNLLQFEADPKLGKEMGTKLREFVKGWDFELISKKQEALYDEVLEKYS